MEQSRERSSAPYLGVVAMEKVPFDYDRQLYFLLLQSYLFSIAPNPLCIVSNNMTLLILPLTFLPS